MTRTIRLLLLGDQDVGKSSFISTIIGQKLAKYQTTFSLVVLPTTMCQGTRDVTTHLIDSNPRKPEQFPDMIKKAELILLFYDVCDRRTVDRLTTYWMPLISKISQKVPIIIVGNKLDKKDDKSSRMPSSYLTIKEVLKPIIRKYKQVEMGLQCSATLNRSVGSVLSCAQRAVLYPLAPLYDLSSIDLTQKFKKSLIRIFRALDKDGDGLLSDKEMTNLQNRVFDSNLQFEDLKKIKEVIKVELQQQEMTFINQQGFFTLNKKCIQMLNIHICWGILRHFNYNDQLQLIPVSNRYFNFQQDSGCSMELRQKPISFLKVLYQSCSRRHQKQKTSEKLMEDIFYPSDTGIPIDEFIRPKQRIELSDFILAWHYLAYSDYLHCYHSLRSIGYEGDLESTFLMRREKVSLRDMYYIQNRTIISVGILDSGGYETPFIDSLFFRHHDEYGLQRSNSIYSLQTGSKIIYLFRLNKDNIQKFFYHKSRMLDIVVYFEGALAESQRDQVLYNIPEWIMVRRISKTEAQDKLGMRTKPELSEKPVPGKRIEQRKFFDLVWHAIRNPTECYDQQTINRLSMLNELTFFQKDNIAVLSFFLALLVISGYLILRRRQALTR